MRIFQNLVSLVKNIILIPRNLASVSKFLNDLNRIETKVETLNQKLNELDFDSIFKRLDTLSQNQTNINSVKQNVSNGNEKKEFDSNLQKKIENQFLQIEALLSIYNSLPNLKYIPTTRGWAGSPDFLNKIVEIILKEKPCIVLEASSGVSSVLIGLALKMNNSGKAFSFEHDTSYAEITRKNIKVNNIEDISIIMDCPLNDYLIDGETWKWYNTKELTFTDKIDLLIIDGPPRATQNLARYPAIPLIHKYFSDNVIIILDDANRPDEIIIVEKWIEFLEKEGYKINIERYINYEKGMVLLNINRKESKP